MDTDEIVSESQLKRTAETVLGILNILERNYCMVRRFDGLLCLSNPQFNLYLPTWDPAQRMTRKSQREAWHHLMSCIMRYFDGNVTILDIAERHNLYFDDVLAYVEKFAEKGLVSLHRG